MRTYKVKTNTEVNRRKGEGGVNNDILAWRKLIQTSPSEAEIRRKEENKDVDTGETFSASDTPELVVFIQESDYQSIKDIFIDREVPFHSMYYTDVNDDKEPGKSLKIMSSISNEIEQDFHKFVTKRHALDNLMKNDQEDSDGLDDKSFGKMTSGMRRKKEFQIGDSVTLKPMETLAIGKINDNSNILSDQVSSHSEAESECTLHLSDSSLTTMSSSPDEFIQGSEGQQPRKAKTLSMTKDRMSRSLTAPSQNIVNEIAHGNSASCAVSPFSGPIPCSGLRSSSSTASSHSFAFPILPSEWNGSPVRMAEADPRRARKHQSWRTCFLWNPKICCFSSIV